MKKIENKLYDLDIVDIQKYLKNRYPLLMIDRVTEIIQGKSSKGFKNFTYNEWFFPAHFEDNPNVPGVITLEALIEMFIMSFITLPECLGKETTDVKVDQLHFHKKIVPGDRLDILTELKRFRFGVATGTAEGFVNDEKVCSCKLVVCVPELVNEFKPNINGD